ncbi:glycosyltransferase [Microbacterium sp. zg-YB36]|uniref:glycosyltransferase n=1 Tax=Microbacterium sp. zg-YB36 TaxID=2969407 RepID=UPI00214B7FCE|nr:glycosyltransferase [Microbacterium sp. zg-YB36]MDL5352582.1 glycosyltransferase [Microbacterium sp. zg-YB36]
MIGHLRTLWRGARRIPLLGNVLAVADRLWWARVIRRAEIVDVELVTAQLGRPTSAAAAVRRYVRGGFRQGLVLNPLFCEATASRQLPDSERVPALYAYLVADKTRIDVSPNWDARARLAENPDAQDDPAGILGYLWRRREQGATIRLGHGGSTAEVAWDHVRAISLSAVAPADTTIGGTVSESEATHEALLAVVDDSDVDYDLAIAAIAAVAPRVAQVRVAVTAESAGIRLQTALMTLWAPNSEVSLSAPSPLHDALRRLAAALPDRIRVVAWRAPGVQMSAAGLLSLLRHGATAVVAPLWLNSDGTVVGLGTVRHDGGYVRLFAGHPREDAIRAADDSGLIPLRAPLGDTGAGPAGVVENALRSLTRPDGVMAAVASHARAAGVPTGVLTGVTAAAHTPVPDSTDGPPVSSESPAGQEDGVAEALARAGFAMAAGGNSLVTVPRPPARRPDGRTVPRLRWAIRTAAPAGPRGEAWGDTHFARGVADALRRLGQEVVIDAFEARHRRSTYLDDVTLVLRGPHRILPSVHGISLLWIISHPDEITAEEITRFDHVFAASRSWASQASARWRMPVDPLLQCTDAERFRPHGLARTDDIVFVGTARGIARPSVVGPIRAGIPVHVYGPDWRGFIPASAIADTAIDNALLPARYETARVVLNDHWPAMQAAGFISNRPYDVVAAGGRVISDHVAGIEEEFSGAVVTYRDTDELIEILRGDLDSLFPADERLREISDGIRARDSFDARAAALLDAALTVGHGTSQPGPVTWSG